MREIDAVLCDFLRVAGECPFAADRLGPARFGKGRMFDHIEHRGNPLGVIPRPYDPVLFRYGIGADNGLALGDRRNGLGVGNVDAEPIGTERPTVERAAQIAAFHPAAMPHVRAQMGAIGIEQTGFAFFRAEQHLIPAEIVNGPHITGRQFVAITYEIPAKWNPHRKPLQHRHSLHYGPVCSRSRHSLTQRRIPGNLRDGSARGKTDRAP